MSQQGSFPRDQVPGALSALLKNVRLGWRLLRDPLVPTWIKLIPLGAALYVVLPIDLFPDVFIGLGQLDDLGVLVLGLRTFISMCPTQIVQRHLASMSSIDGSYHVVEEEPPHSPVAGYLQDGPVSAKDEAAPPIVEGAAKPTVQKS